MFGIRAITNPNPTIKRWRVSFAFFPGIVLALFVLSAVGCASSARTGSRSSSGPESDHTGGLARLGELQRASHLIGMELKNFRDEKLGVISDLAMELESAQLVLLFASKPGFFGLGGKTKAIPPGALLQHTDGKTLVLDIEKEQWTGAPTIEPPAWVRQADLSLLEAIYRHYAVPCFWKETAARTPLISSREAVEHEPLQGAGQPQTGIESRSETFPPIASPDWESSGLKTDQSRLLPIRIIAASDVIGTKVKNSKNENLGNVRDLILDLVNGRVAYAVISVDGSRSADAKLVAIPPSALTSHASKAFLFNADKHRLQGAPGFTENVWPDFGNVSWGADVYRYYGREPYWEEQPMRSYFEPFPRPTDERRHRNPKHPSD
jgi:sporulation protein YlmC with PRC-barrel domain